MKKVTSAVFLAGSVLAAASAHADVTVGFSGVMSGPAAVLGQDQHDGFMLAIEQLGGKFGDQKVNVVSEDDQLKPDVGAQIMQKFIERDKVDAIVGLGFSNVLMAELRRVKESGVPALATNAGPAPVAGKLCSKNLFGLAWQNDTMSEAMGQYVQDIGLKSAYLMAPSYQAGKDKLNGFKRYYKGKIVKEVYTPLGQLDYSAEISNLQAAKPDALFVFYPGGLGINFIRQLGQAGLMGHLPFFSESLIDSNTLVALKTQAAGAIYGATWSPVLDNAQNQKFVKAYKEKYGRVPSEYAANAYDAAYLLDAAVRKVKGNVSDRAAFVAAVKEAGSTFPTVRGKFAFNTNNMPIQNLYAFKVVKDGDKVEVKKLATVFTDHQDAYVSKCGMK